MESGVRTVSVADGSPPRRRLRPKLARLGRSGADGSPAQPATLMVGAAESAPYARATTATKWACRGSTRARSAASRRGRGWYPVPHVSLNGEAVRREEVAQSGERQYVNVLPR